MARLKPSRKVAALFVTKIEKRQFVITLQNIILPEPDICAEQPLFARLNEACSMDYATNSFVFAKGGKASFDTYFNSFTLKKWANNTLIKDLFLELEGSGTVAVEIYHAPGRASWALAQSRVITLKSGTPQALDLSSLLASEDLGLIYVEIKAHTQATVHNMRYATKTQPASWPKLAVSVTTFKREAAVEKTVCRVENFIETYAHRENLHIFVVDNGQSANIKSGTHTTYVPNDNLGGAGGFSRGLLEAETAGFTHVLFTDDDASFMTESLHRAYVYLALAQDDRTAVAGGMINNEHKWQLWENGARFNGGCKPDYHGLDLRDPGQLHAMEIETSATPDPDLYGGWWFFAFPIKHATSYPFPFFVRGDDVSFSLVNDFKINVLGGVASFQDGFVEKESPMTWYLDLRSHLAHHLQLPQMDIGALGTAKIAVWFVLRNFIRFHYETIEACHLALEDVMQGPDFFDENKDMAERRGRIKALTKAEVFAPMSRADKNLPMRMHPIHSKWRLRVSRITLNGHLVPFYNRFGPRFSVRAQDKGIVGMAWGASAITYVDSVRDVSYTAQIQQLRGLKLLWKTAKLAIEFMRRYPELSAEYRKNYPTVAAKSYWDNVYASTDDAASEDKTA